MSLVHVSCLSIHVCSQITDFAIDEHQRRTGMLHREHPQDIILTFSQGLSEDLEAYASLRSRQADVAGLIAGAVGVC